MDHFFSIHLSSRPPRLELDHIDSKIYKTWLHVQCLSCHWMIDHTVHILRTVSILPIYMVQCGLSWKMWNLKSFHWQSKTPNLFPDWSVGEGSSLCNVKVKLRNMCEVVPIFLLSLYVMIHLIAYLLNNSVDKIPIGWTWYLPDFLPSRVEQTHKYLCCFSN